MNCKIKLRTLFFYIRDEQNVKRRVYDALNVLIAANVLKRDGRRIKI
jgi:hypothetical protein